MPAESRNETENDAGKKLLDGLNEIIDERTPDDESWCPNCEEYAEFEEIQTVERPEHGVENTVKGCPNCPHTCINQTEWTAIDNSGWSGPESAALQHHPIDLLGNWPLPTTESEATALWEGHDQLQREYDEPPHPDELNDRYVHTVVKTDCWGAFEVTLFGYGARRYFWNRFGGYGFYVDTTESELEELVDLFEVLLEEER